MTKLAITCMDGTERVFVRLKTTLGAPSILETVGFNKATLFDNPDTAEHVLHEFDIVDPQIEVVDVKFVRTIKGNEDKYTVFLHMSSERMIPDTETKEKEGKTKGEWTDEDRNYPLYLFVMLWHNEYPKHSRLEYDLSYEMIIDAWKEFTASGFDDPDEPLYECILDFFREKQPVRVMFRKIISNPQAGDVIAFFLDQEFTFHNNTIGSYMHTGQHSDACREFVIGDTISTKSGCDTHGCLLKELESIGYENLEVVDDLTEAGKTPRCLYCNSGNGPTHFICESCGDGMCDECYDADKEHEAHYQDPAQSADGEEQYLIMEDSFGGGYGCDTCVNKAVAMGKTMEGTNDQ